MTATRAKAANAASAERFNAYRLMLDADLARAIVQLEEVLDAMAFSERPADPAQRALFADALDQARAELERRRV